MPVFRVEKNSNYTSRQKGAKTMMELNYTKNGDCPIQYDLFTDVKSLDRQERLDAAIKQIRFRFGKDAIKNGVLFQKSKMPTERKVDLVMPTGMIG